MIPNAFDDSTLAFSFASCIRRWTAGILVALCVSSPLHASESTDRVASGNTILVGGNNDFAPYEFLGKDGRPQGFSVALMKAVARQVGLNVDIQLGPWHEMIGKLETKQIDALSGLLYSRQRDNKFDFSVPHTIISYAVFVRKGGPYHSVGDLKNRQVIVVEDVYAHEWLQTNRFTPHIFTVKNPREALRMIDAGRKTVELRKSQTLLNQIVHGLPMATFVVDRNNLITQWNKACESLTGASEADVLGTEAHCRFFYGENRTPLSQPIIEPSSQADRYNFKAEEDAPLGTWIRGCLKTPSKARKRR
jgi:hypothetical protein